MKFVSIIGAGTMGLGITQVFLQSNYKVKIIDLNEEVLRSGKDRLSSIFKKLVEVFAAQIISVISKLRTDNSVINVNGG